MNDALRELRLRKIKVYAVGIGTKTGVPWLSLLRGLKEGIDYPQYYAYDWSGGVIPLDLKILERITNLTGGSVFDT